MYRIIKRLINLAGDNRKKLYIAFIMSFFEVIFLNVPIGVILFILNDISTGQFSMDRMWPMVWIMIAGLLLQYLFKIFVFHFQNGTGFRIIGEQRKKIGERLRRLPMGYFSNTNAGHIASAITSDLTLVELHAMRFISNVINAFCTMIITGFFLLFIDFRMALIALAAYPAAFLIYRKIQTMFKNYARIRQNAQVNLTSDIIEYIHGISVIKAFNMSGTGFKKFAASAKSFETAALEYEMKAVPWFAGYSICFHIGTGLILYFGPYYYFAGELSIATLLMFMVLSFRIYMPIEIIGIISGILRLMDAALDRVEDVKSIPLLDEKDMDKKINSHDIEFKNVYFSYGERDVIKNVSFKIKAGTMTALVGPSGSGKTTITSLIARFWDIRKGEIFIGGTNIKDMKCDSIQSHISTVFQDVYLFNDTILNNIKFGKPEATMDEVVAASEKAKCHDFIKQLENGYDTMVGEGGTTLSGGEKQRITIARAILKDAPIVFLDEATSSLDPENETKIQEAINALLKDKTIVIIAHRLSTIRNADQILVLNNGNLIQCGTHDELSSMDGIYSAFWQRRQKSRHWKLGKESATVSVKNSEKSFA